MIYEYREAGLGGYFRLTTGLSSTQLWQLPNDHLIHIIWNRNEFPVELTIDATIFHLLPQQLTTITYLHKTGIGREEQPIIVFSFNREFYCIQDHDEEVSCNGIIFFGAQELPLIQLDEKEILSFELLYQIFLEEFQTRDNIQGEMLRMLLKRLIIKCTRLAKEQTIHAKVEKHQLELLRKYNFLVDQHFRKLKTVKDYADLLNKSPKTLSNLFKLSGLPSPLHLIHERVVLEARRLLAYSDKSVKEIAYELGYEELASFHKLFKKQNGLSPAQFREQLKSNSGNMVRHSGSVASYPPTR